MAATNERVSTSRVIAAEPQELFDVVADPSLHHVIDGSGTVTASTGSAARVWLASPV